MVNLPRFFTRVNFTMVDFCFHTIIFLRSTWRTFRASGIFRTVLKTLDIQDNKKHNPDGPSLISEVSESSERASESKFKFALQKKNTNVCWHYLVWLSEWFQMFLWRQFWKVAYQIVQNPAITTNHNMLFFWCCWK